MVFNLNTFKSKIDQYGGPARKNLFTVEFVSQNQTEVERDLIFFCKDVTVPGIHLNTVDYRSDGYNFPAALPTGIEKEQLTVLVMLDDNHNILTFFHEWLQKVYNYDESNGKYAPRAGDENHLPYTLNYKDEYSCRMIVKSYSTSGNFYEIVFDGVYPSTLASLNLGWGFNGDAQDLSISFSYSSMKVKGTRTGSPGDVPLIRINGSSQILNFNQPTFITDLKNVINNSAKAIQGLKTLFS